MKAKEYCDAASEKLSQTAESAKQSAEAAKVKAQEAAAKAAQSAHHAAAKAASLRKKLPRWLKRATKSDRSSVVLCVVDILLFCYKNRRRL